MQSDGRDPRRRRPKVPDEVVADLARVSGPHRGSKLVEQLDAARRSFERERYAEARRIAAAIAKEAPDAGAVRELLGLTLYRLDRYRDAARELEAYRSLTGEVDQNPVLADCYRALKRHGKVDELWVELREVSPSAELVAEGRIVAAGSLADRGQIEAAIALLEKAPKPKGRVRTHHLREWYALADLWDRAGDPSRARRLFRAIAEQDMSFADVTDRLRSLGT